VGPLCVGTKARHARADDDKAEKPEAIAAMLDFSAQTRTAMAAGEEVDAVAILPEFTKDVKPEMGSFLIEGTGYYKTERGSHPRSTSKVHPLSWDTVVSFEAFQYNYLIAPRPLLVIAGSRAEPLHMAKRAYAVAKEPKELFLVDSKTHFDLYDDAPV